MSNAEQTFKSPILHSRYLILGVFALVAILQFWFVAGAGTDIPIWDQWNVEGERLYPHFVDGSMQVNELVMPHNEHRIFWTNAMNVGLFALNKGWDPLVQLLVGVLLRAGTAALLCALFIYRIPRFSSYLLASAIVLAYLPFLSWHNVLWGFQSAVWFSLLFGLCSVHLAA